MSDGAASSQHERTVEPAIAPPVPGSAPGPGPVLPPSVGHVVALQRTAGNAAVTRWLSTAPSPLVQRDAPAAAPAAPPAPQPRVSYVFLTGDFKNDAFYNAARQYFANMAKGATLVTDKRTLADIISHVNAQGKPVDTLYVVSHANESGNLGFSVDATDAAKDAKGGDHKPRSEYNEIKTANDEGALPTADVALIDDQTKVVIKGCNIGRSELMLEEIDKAFGGEATVTAPTHTQEYKVSGDGKGTVTYEENFSEMFVEAPGLATKNAATLAAEFKAKYPQVPAGKWAGLLAKVKKETTSKPRYTHTQPNPPADDEASVLARLGAKKKYPADKGWVLTYKGRETVGDRWKFTIEAERVTEDGGTEAYTDFITAQIPPDEAALIAQEKAKHGRPDAYDWSVKRSIKGNELVMDVMAERTEWIVPGTIKDASGPYHPAQSDADWYKTSTFDPPPPPPATP